MGSCAACVGPNRRAQKYKVNRLTQDSPLKSSVTPSQLPIRRHQDRVISQINQSKRGLDHNNLIGTLLSSSALYPESGGNSNSRIHNHKAVVSAFMPRDSFESYGRESYDLGNRGHESMVRRESKISNADQNTKVFQVGKVLQRSFAQSKYAVEIKSPYISSSSSTSYFPEYKKEPLTEVFGNKSTEISRSLKANRLLNIPELSEEDAKTPKYVNEKRKENGQDVLRTGLQGIPIKLESVPSANLYKYLKDLE